jgi:predicted RNA methylase
MDSIQFYPTPSDLAARMIAKFTVPPFDRDARVLEPSAGDGALAIAIYDAAVAHRDAFVDRESTRYYYRVDPVKVDFIEIDMSKHSVLENIEVVKGRVVGLDFLNFSGSLAGYTHILMNPPFREGVHHVIKAWEGLYDGEIVALLNAETVKNTFSKERQRLVRLIEDHGDVEFVQDAFKGEGVEREADVEVAIVHLTKKADLQRDVIGGVLDSLEIDDLSDTGGAGACMHALNTQELAIPGDVIVRTERAFKAAVAAMREAVVARTRAAYLSRLVGKTMAQRNGEIEDEDKPENMSKSIREGIAKGYDDLKDRAWSEVLRSTKVSSKISSRAQQRLESEFERIKRLDFSASNVYAFLIGLIESQGDMHIQMAMDCFDEITKYHEDNAVWYMGWKSNGKHRTAGRRIKMTRFILPRFEGNWGGTSLEYSAMQRLADFDKVFEVLDGKAVGSTFGLAQLFGQNAKTLAQGERLGSHYFDVRWYPGRGTIHFFPKRKDLIDRLNRVVGRARQWLPEREDMVSKDFWLAYERSEKFDAAIRSEVNGSSGSGWNNPFWVATRDRPGDDSGALNRIAQACVKVAQDNGLDPMRGIEAPNQPEQLLLAA